MAHLQFHSASKQGTFLVVALLAGLALGGVVLFPSFRSYMNADGELRLARSLDGKAVEEVRRLLGAPEQRPVGSRSISETLRLLRASYRNLPSVIPAEELWVYRIRMRVIVFGVTAGRVVSVDSAMT